MRGAWMVGAALLVFGGALLDATLTLETLSRLPWLAAGIALALALRIGMRVAPVLAGAWLAAALSTGTPLALALVQALGSTAAVMACASVIRWSGARADLERARDAGMLALAVVAVGGPAMALAQWSSTSLGPVPMPLEWGPALLAWP